MVVEKNLGHDQKMSAADDALDEQARRQTEAKRRLAAADRKYRQYQRRIGT